MMDYHSIVQSHQEALCGHQKKKMKIGTFQISKAANGLLIYSKGQSKMLTSNPKRTKNLSPWVLLLLVKNQFGNTSLSQLSRKAEKVSHRI